MKKGLLAAVVTAVALSSQISLAQESEQNVSQSANNENNSLYGIDSMQSNCSSESEDLDEELDDEENLSVTSTPYQHTKLAAKVGERISCESTATDLINTREKCIPLVNGKNIVAANKGDCSSDSHNCAASNKAEEKNTWIFVPKGVCNKILAGDFSNVPDAVKHKLTLNAKSKPGAGSKK